MTPREWAPSCWQAPRWSVLPAEIKVPGNNFEMSGIFPISENLSEFRINSPLGFRAFTEKLGIPLYCAAWPKNCSAFFRSSEAIDLQELPEALARGKVAFAFPFLAPKFRSSASKTVYSRR